jgi:succinoglycan biosynthesis transport protein ExoP
MNQPPAPGPQPTFARQATAREFLAVLFRRKWIILGLFLITTATVVTVAVTTPAYFISSGRILVKRGERQSLLRPDRQIFSDWEQELGSEMQILKSAPVVKRAREMMLAEGKKTNQPMTLDPASIDVEVMGKSNVIAVGYTALDPIVAQTACRVVMDAYMDYRRSKLNTDQPKEFFERQISDLEARISARLEERRRYTEATGVAVPMQQTQSWLAQVSMLEQRRSDVSTDLAAAQSVEEAMRRMLTDADIDLPTFDGANQFTNEQALVTLKTRVVEQQAKIAILTETLRDDAPEVVGARQTLETLQGLLHKEVEARVRLAGARVAQMRSKVAVLDQEIANIRQQLVSAPDDLKKMDEIDNDLSALRLRLKDLTDSRDQAMITANTSQDVNVVMLAPAGVATPSNQLDVVRLLLAPAFSLLVGIAIAFFIDGLDLTVRTANQAEEYLDLPVLASLSERRRRS